jgi:hypothetical protein
MKQLGVPKDWLVVNDVNHLSLTDSYPLVKMDVK